MFKIFICLLLITSLAILSSGCCSIVKGNRQLVTVTSEPTGAKVKIDGMKGRTPFSQSLSRDKDYIVEVSKEGYETEQRQITKSFGLIFSAVPTILSISVSERSKKSSFTFNLSALILI